MNLKQISGASVAVMAVVGALRSRREDYAKAVMERPAEGVTSNRIKAGKGDQSRLADLAALLDLIEDMEGEIQAETRVGARARLKGILCGLLAVLEEDPEDVLGRVRFGRFGQWFPVRAEPTSKAELVLRAYEAVERGAAPAALLGAVARQGAKLDGARQPTVTAAMSS